MNKEELIQECLKLENDLFMKQSSSDNCYKLVIKKLQEENKKKDAIISCYSDSLEREKEDYNKLLDEN